MMIRPISKKLLKQVRQLKQKKYRRLHGQFVISGLRAVSLALSSNTIEPKYLLVEKQQMALLNRLPAFNGEAVFTLSSAEFSYISDEKTPQGIALVACLPQVSLQNLSLPDRLIFLEQISDPGNFGTILRTASWFGWPVILLGSTSLDPYQPKVVRASAGTIAQVKVVENVSLEALKKIKSQNGYRLIGTTVHQGKPLPDFKSKSGAKYMLAFGSEAHGLSEEVVRMCDQKLTIPKFGNGESLNLAIAVSLFLYQFTALKSA